MSRQQPMRHALPWREPAAVVAAVAQRYGAAGLVWLDGDGSPLGGTARLGFAPQQALCCRGLPGEAGSSDPFTALEQLEQELSSSQAPGSWMGWLAYEAGAWVEPAAHWHHPAMATLWAGRYHHELVFELGHQRLWLESDPTAEAGAMLAAELQELLGGLSAAAGDGALTGLATGLELEPWQWHTSHQGFADQVQQIKTWIASGDLFQANLSACCQSRLRGNPAQPDDAALSLYGRLRRHCPAPFGALAIGTGAARGEAVLCSSPERFLQRMPGGRVETRPIKGTRPRSSDPNRDAAWAAELVSSPKDRAENVMIVDLLRNDLGRVCTPGTIEIPQLVGLESYPQVHHLTSVIEGQLRPGVGVAELLRACWPGGSITGAPKIRACQRLNELEPVARGPYCGSLFRLGSDGSFDSNILIRSLMLKDTTIRAHAGCGIVADSDPDAEAEEMGWKIQPLLDALSAA